MFDCYQIYSGLWISSQNKIKAKSITTVQKWTAVLQQKTGRYNTMQWLMQTDSPWSLLMDPDAKDQTRVSYSINKWYYCQENFDKQKY